MLECVRIIFNIQAQAIIRGKEIEAVDYPEPIREFNFLVDDYTVLLASDK